MNKYNTKAVAHYQLNKIKELIRQGKCYITNKAIENAQGDFNIKPTEIYKYIIRLDNTHFYKSMTCDGDNRMWQDVYHFPVKPNKIAYIKLQISLEDETVVIQFKRK